MQITLVHSSAPRMVLEVSLQVPEGCTALLALETAGWMSAYPELGTQALTLGVWGRRVGPAHVLRDGDRLEVYRALRVDPKVARRERFVGQGARGTGLFARRKAGSKAGY
ncbi:RnfH family protein [Hydrogenophaga sp.]|uniref:RnfH family protein n=1 Tax=Hydrogenophaga sp. TaxID=1904254 RepID=UPI00272F2F84|nr:RnfH family protein [Hydrogenophaga sp.]MDP2015629.1 RnfH family protein [Hydrogenophaga sp.]MDP3166330.1 RnfH family protein [Hydrogenophaga sp.]MDP3811899.1 RnfH family protein [Hydrogenophaga sp.]